MLAAQPEKAAHCRSIHEESLDEKEPVAQYVAERCERGRRQRKGSHDSCRQAPSRDCAIQRRAQHRRLLDRRRGRAEGQASLAPVMTARPCAVRGEDIITTPDERYLVVRGRLWRASDPRLSPDRRAELVQQLMTARRSLRKTADAAGRMEARAAVDAAKRGLGERGPVWWTDGAPDFNRKLAKNSPYAGWYASLG